MIFRFLNIYNKIRFLSKSKNFFADVHCMKCRIRWENKKFDDMSTLICNKAYISMGCKEAERKLGSTDDVDYLYQR